MTGAAPPAAQQRPSLHRNADRKPRYAVLDFARLMAVFMMMQGHAIGTFVRVGAVPAEGVAGDLYMRIRGLTSPTFLLISGIVNFVGVTRDEHGRVLPRILRSRALRAITLIIIDYLLIFPANRIWDVFFLTSSQWFQFFRVGTLNIIGVSLLLATGLMAVTRSDRSLLIWSFLIGTGIAVATPYVHAVDWFSLLPAYFAHYLSLRGGGFFAIFPHTAYLFIGLSLGGFTLRLLGDAHRWTLTTGFAVAGVAIGLVTMAAYPLTNPLLPPHDYWISSPYTVGEKVALSLVLAALWSVLYRATEGAASFYSRLSRKNIHIYVAHILLIFGNTWVWSLSRVWHNSLDLAHGIGAAALVITLSYGVGICVMWLEEHRPHAWWWVRVAFGATLAWLLLVGN